MKLFSYVIRDKERKVIKGLMPFGSEEALKKHFRDQGYLVLSITEKNQNEKQIEPVSPHFEGSGLLKILLPFVGIGLIIFALLKIPSDLFKSDVSPGAKPISKHETTIDNIERITPSEPAHKVPEESVEKTVPPPQEKAVAYTHNDTTIIKLKGKKPENVSTFTPLSKRTSYQLAIRAYRRRNKQSCRQAIRHAQDALANQEGDAQTLKDIIRECRKMH